jgi:hypothetical protein
MQRKKKSKTGLNALQKQVAPASKRGFLSLFLSYMSRQCREELPSEHRTDGSLSLLPCQAVHNSSELPAKSEDTTLSFFSAASSFKDGKNSVLSMEAKNNSLSSFARLSSAAEPKTRTERNRSTSLLLSSKGSSDIDTDSRQQRLDGRE